MEKMQKFTENLVFSFKEGSIDEEKRTVKVCALATCVSKNGRFYSPKVVEGASGSLVGKKSFADHDTRDTKNLIGRIVSEEYRDGKLYADIKISRASGIAKQTWEKLTDGTLTDVSIAADGQTKRVKLGDRVVDEVVSLDIKSVDFVTEGGVQDAKVLHVYENIKDIPEISEVKEEMKIENVEQLRVEYASLVEAIEKSLKDEIATITKAKEDAEFKLIEKEMAEFRESEISKLDTTDKVKDILRKKVAGKTKEEITASIASEFEFIKMIEGALKKDNPVEGIPAAEIKKEEKQEIKSWSSSRIMSESKIPENLKLRCTEMLTLEGSAKMLEFLKSSGIEL